MSRSSRQIVLPGADTVPQHKAASAVDAVLRAATKRAQTKPELKIAHIAPAPAPAALTVTEVAEIRLAAKAEAVREAAESVKALLEEKNVAIAAGVEAERKLATALATALAATETAVQARAQTQAVLEKVMAEKVMVEKERDVEKASVAAKGEQLLAERVKSTERLTAHDQVVLEMKTLRSELTDKTAAASRWAVSAGVEADRAARAEAELAAVRAELAAAKQEVVRLTPVTLLDWVRETAPQFLPS